MLNAFFDRVLDRPWRAMAICVAVTLLAVAGAPGLGFTTAYDAYFSPQNPEWRAYKSIEKAFERTDNVLFALAPAAGDVFTRETLATVRELTDAAWELPYAKSVSSLANFHDAYARGDELAVEPLVPTGELDDGALATVRERAVDNPRVAGSLLADDGEVTGVVVSFELPQTERESAVRRIAGAVRDLADRVEAERPDLEVYLTGAVMLNQAMIDSIRWDLTYLYPPFFLIMFAVLALFFRSLGATLATLAILLMAVGTAFGAAGWAGITLNTASVSSAIIILTLAVADSVHILVGYANARVAGNERRPALLESLRVNAQPVFLTSLTTALGFLGMNFSDSPPFRDLGNIVALGVAAAFVYSLVFLPAALTVLPSEVATGRGRGLLAALAEFVIRRRRALLVAGAVALAGLSAAIGLNRFGDNYVEFFDHSLEFRRDTEFINRELTGMQLIEYPLEAGASGDVHDPEFLRRVDRLVDWFREQPEVRRVVAVTELIKRLNQTFHGGDPAYHRIPESRELAAQLLFFYEMSLPQGMDITNLVNLDKSAARVAVVLDPILDQRMRDLDERAQDWMAEHLSPDTAAPGSSISIMFAYIAERNFRSMLLGTLMAFAFIAVAMVLAFRSLRLGLLSLFPNLAPLAMGFGAWGLLVGQTGVATSVVASLTLGIVVDDTVHLLSKYRRARRERGLAPHDALRDAFANVGTALCLTSLVLVVGFVLMTLSSFSMTQHMGALTAMIIVLALVVDFLFLPPLLLLLDRR
ncbi:RND efflux transporter [Salinisphaera sp. PC39]|uniref:efflux RND transporter permease subunit n=1 Tax=Salinisphaera sp. PC39 TaxID=1304156 RepID=UPI00333EEF34